MKLDELESVNKATKPVESGPISENWRPGMPCYSVEQVNRQLDEYRWWAVYVTNDHDAALRALARYRQKDPGRSYRLIMAIQLDGPSTP